MSILLLILIVITGICWCLLNIRLINKKINLFRFSLFKIIIENFAHILPFLLIVFVIKSFIFESFYIPSSSMAPTLLIGDLILVKKFAYNIKDPFFNKTLIHINKPKYGDVVIFKYPMNTKLNYIKRIIGLPGDHIKYNPITKKVSVITKCNKYYKNLNIKYKKTFLSNFILFFNKINKNNISFGVLENINNDLKTKLLNKNNYAYINLLQQTESINNKKHDILYIPKYLDKIKFYFKQFNNVKFTWIVPKGHYFVLGDYRDNSEDSRYWGFVPEENVIGKAYYVWMSFKKQENKWPTGLRLKHIGVIH
ncbi:MAG: signal peptidase I [Enterobacterales bacterium]